MSWLRLDDTFGHHPKVVPLSDRAFRVHVLALCYASQHETDGFIPAGVLPVVMGTKRTAAELEQAGLWEPAEGGWVIHDYLLYNPSRAELEEERKRRSEQAAAAAFARWSRRPRDAREMPAASPKRRPEHSPEHAPSTAANDAQSMLGSMPGACSIDAEQHAESNAPAMPERCSNDATSPIRPLENDDSSLRSSSSLARKARDDDLQSPPVEPAGGSAAAAAELGLDAFDPDPPAVREVRDLVLMALPRKFQADPLTFDEALQLGRDFAGAHEAVGAAIAECRRRNQLPFPSRVRAILQEVQREDAQGRPWGADDPILAQLRASGALVE